MLEIIIGVLIALIFYHIGSVSATQSFDNLYRHSMKLQMDISRQNVLIARLHGDIITNQNRMSRGMCVISPSEVEKCAEKVTDIKNKIQKVIDGIKV